MVWCGCNLFQNFWGRAVYALHTRSHGKVSSHVSKSGDVSATFEQCKKRFKKKLALPCWWKALPLTKSTNFQTSLLSNFSINTVLNKITLKVGNVRQVTDETNNLVYIILGVLSTHFERFSVARKQVFFFLSSEVGEGHILYIQQDWVNMGPRVEIQVARVANILQKHWIWKYDRLAV